MKEKNLSPGRRDDISSRRRLTSSCRWLFSVFISPPRPYRYYIYYRSLSLTLSQSVSQSVCPSAYLLRRRLCQSRARQPRYDCPLQLVHSRARVYDTQRGAVSAVTHLRSYRMCIYIYTNACCTYTAAAVTTTRRHPPTLSRGIVKSVARAPYQSAQTRPTKKIAHNNIIIHT